MFEHHYPDATLSLDEPTEPFLDEQGRIERSELLKVRLTAEAFAVDDELVWLGRALDAVGGVGAATRRGDGVVTALGGCYEDGWLLPNMALGFAARTSLRRIRLDCVLGPHLPVGTTITYFLNDRAVAVAGGDPGARFSVDIEVPHHLDGIDKLLRAQCSVALDPCSAGHNSDRRALSALLIAIMVTEASGAETVIGQTELLAGERRR